MSFSSCDTQHRITKQSLSDGYEFLFNGTDLSGWVNVNNAPDTWLINDNSIFCTGKVQSNLRTVSFYENYILEFEYLPLEKNGDAAVLIHADGLPSTGQPFPKGIRCSISNNSTFTTLEAINGASLNKNELANIKHQMIKINQWNKYRIESSRSEISVLLNGNLIGKGTTQNLRSGYISFASTKTAIYFRNIKIKELETANPPAEQRSVSGDGFRSLYNSFDLSEWKMLPGHLNHWTILDGMINYDGKSAEKDKSLWSKKQFRDFILIADVRLTRKPEMAMSSVILPNGENAINEDGSNKEVEIPYAGDTGIYLRGNSKSQVNIGNRFIGSGEIYGYRADKKLPPEVRASATPKIKADKPPGEWNRFVITMKGERVTVMLNNQLVIDNALLPGIPARGAIALQDDHANNNTFQFANLFIKEFN